MRVLGRRRGALVALAVGLAILVLYVVLQPGERPRGVASADSTTTTSTTTTTRPPLEELCELATEFEAAAVDQDDPNVGARLAETFYARATEIVGPEARPEYDAAARYYTEYNNIGERYEYELFAILASPDGERWLQLLLREPLGVEAARAHVAFLCHVEIPPPPTVTTTTTRPRPATTAAPESDPDQPAPQPGDGTGTPATPAPATPPPAPAPNPGPG